jgi:DNA-binding SARP family transcriptional activator
MPPRGASPAAAAVPKEAKATCELLPDWYDECVLIEREHLRELRVHTLELVCERLTQQRRCSEAVEVALTAIAEDPLRKSARPALISVYVAEGNCAKAIEHYQTVL